MIIATWLCLDHFVCRFQKFGDVAAFILRVSISGEQRKSRLFASNGEEQCFSAGSVAFLYMDAHVPIRGRRA